MISLFSPTQNGFGQGFLRMAMSLPDAPDKHLGEIIKALDKLVLDERGRQRVTLLRFQFEHPRRIQTASLQHEVMGFDGCNPREEIRRNQVGEWDKTGAKPPFAVPIHLNVFASPDTTGEMLSEGLHSKPVSELVITDAHLARSNAFAASSPYAC